MGQSNTFLCTSSLSYGKRSADQLETGNTDRVLDGDIEDFIVAYLKNIIRDDNEKVREENMDVESVVEQEIETL